MRSMTSRLSIFAEKIKAGDVIAAAVIVAAALILAFFFLHPRGNVVEVRRDGTLLCTIDLSDPQNEGKTFDVKGDYTNTLTVSDQQIRVSDSDCPGKDCVHSTPIGKGGSVICCAPNRMTVSLKDGASVDVITQ